MPVFRLLAERTGGRRTDAALCAGNPFAISNLMSNPKQAVASSPLSLPPIHLHLRERQFWDRSARVPFMIRSRPKTLVPWLVVRLNWLFAAGPVTACSPQI